MTFSVDPEADAKPPNRSGVTLIWSSRRNQSHSSLVSLSRQRSIGNSCDGLSRSLSNVSEPDCCPLRNTELSTRYSRLRNRRSAVSSVASSGNLVSHFGFNPDELLDPDYFEMPVKKNTFKITARFIGSLQKHSVPKSKAERVAAAAVLATCVTESSRYLCV